MFYYFQRRYIILLIIIAITISLLLLPVGSTHALNWPIDFTSSSPDQFTIENINQPTQTLVFDTWQLPPNQNLIIRNCVLNKISVGIRADSTENLFFLNGTSKFIIENSRLGQFDFIARFADQAAQDGAYQKYGIIQLNDESQLIIRNNVFDPHFGEDRSASPTSTKAKLFDLELKLNSPSANVFIQNNTFLSVNNNFERSKVVHVKIKAPPFKNNFPTDQERLSELSTTGDGVRPMRFNNFEISNNRFTCELPSSDIGFTAMILSIGEELKLNDETQFHQGNILNISGNTLSIPSTLPCAGSTSMQSRSPGRGFVVEFLSSKSSTTSADGIVDEQYKFNQILLNRNSITIAGTDMILFMGIRFSSATSLLLIDSDSQQIHFDNNFFYKNPTFITNRLQDYTTKNSTVPGVKVEDPTQVFPIPGLSIKAIFVELQVRPTSSSKEISPPQQQQLQQHGILSFNNNHIEFACNEVVGVYCAFANSTNLKTIEFINNTVKSEIFSDADGISLMWQNLFQHHDVINISNNNISLFNVIAEQSNATREPGKMTSELYYLAKVNGFKLQSTSKIADAIGFEHQFKDVRLFQVSRNYFHLNCRREGYGVELRVRFDLLKLLVVHHNHISLLGYWMTSATSSATDLNPGGVDGGDTKLENDVVDKKVMGVRISPSVIFIDTVSIHNNYFFCKSFITGSLGAVYYSFTATNKGTVKSTIIYRNKMFIERMGFDRSELATVGVAITFTYHTERGFDAVQVFDNEIDIVSAGDCPMFGCFGVALTLTTVPTTEWAFRLVNISGNNMTAHNNGLFTAGGVLFSTVDIGESKLDFSLPAKLKLGEGNGTIESGIISHNNFLIRSEYQAVGVAFITSGLFIMRSFLAVNNTLDLFDGKMTTARTMLIAITKFGGTLRVNGLDFSIESAEGSRFLLRENLAEAGYPGLAQAASSPPSSISADSTNDNNDNALHPGEFVVSNCTSKHATNLIRIDSEYCFMDSIILRNSTLLMGNTNDLSPRNQKSKQPVEFAPIAVMNEMNPASFVRRKIEIEYVDIRSAFSSSSQYCNDPLPRDVLPSSTENKIDTINLFHGMGFSNLNPLENSFKLILRNVSAEFRCESSSRHQQSQRFGASFVRLAYPPHGGLDICNVKVVVKEKGSLSTMQSISVGLVSYSRLRPEPDSSAAASYSSTSFMLNISKTDLVTFVADDSSSSSSPLPSSVSASLLRNPIPEYSPSETDGKFLPSSSLRALVDCFTWNKKLTTIKSPIIKSSPFNLYDSLIGCNGKYGGFSTTMTRSSLLSETHPFENTSTLEASRSVTLSEKITIDIKPVSAARLEAALASTVLASAISPQTLLSGANGIALLQLARCAAEYEFNDHFSEQDPLFEKKLVNYSKTVLESEVSFPVSFLPGLKVNGSEYKGAVLSHFIAFGLGVAVLIFVGSFWKTSWKKYVVSSSSASSKQLATKAGEKVDKMSIFLFAPFDLILLRICFFIVSLGASASGSIIAARSSPAGDKVMAIILQLFVGGSIVGIGVLLKLHLSGHFLEKKNNKKTKTNNGNKKIRKPRNEEQDVDDPEFDWDVNASGSSSSSNTNNNKRNKPIYHTEASSLYFKRESISTSGEKRRRGGSKVFSESSDENRPSSNKNNNKDKESLISRLRQLLLSSFGRWCLIGNEIWFNKYSDLKEGAQRRGPGIQSQFSFMFRKTIGPLKEDQASSSNNNNKNPKSAHQFFSDWQDRLMSKTRPTSSYDNSLRRRLAPFYLYFATFCTMIISVNLGAGNVAPDTCKARFFVCLIFTLLSTLLFFFTRPSLIPARNIMNGLIDFCILVGGMLLCSFVLELSSSSSSSGAAAELPNKHLFESAEVLCTLPATILGAFITLLSGVRFLLVRVTKAMIVPTTEVRLHLGNELDHHEEMMRFRSNSKGRKMLSPRRHQMITINSSSENTSDSPQTPSTPQQREYGGHDEEILLNSRDTTMTMMNLVKGKISPSPPPERGRRDRSRSRKIDESRGPMSISGVSPPRNSAVRSPNRQLNRNNNNNQQQNSPHRRNNHFDYNNNNNKRSRTYSSSRSPRNDPSL